MAKGYKEMTAEEIEWDLAKRGLCPAHVMLGLPPMPVWKAKFYYWKRNHLDRWWRNSLPSKVVLAVRTVRQKHRMRKFAKAYRKFKRG